MTEITIRGAKKSYLILLHYIQSPYIYPIYTGNCVLTYWEGKKKKKKGIFLVLTGVILFFPKPGTYWGYLLDFLLMDFSHLFNPPRVSRVVVGSTFANSWVVIITFMTFCSCQPWQQTKKYWIWTTVQQAPDKHCKTRVCSYFHKELKQRW